VLDCFSARAANSIALTPIKKEDFSGWLKKQNKSLKTWVERIGFNGKAGTSCPLPGTEGPKGYLVGIGAGELWDWAAVPGSLPAGRYRYERGAGDEAALGWALASYRFTRYKESNDEPRVLVWPEGADRAEVERLAEATYVVRDLINTPSSDMGPAELADEAKKIAKRHDASVSVIVGKQLLEKNYPTIHTVGRASVREPRLIDIRWGNKSHRKVTLVGKGVCFDTGGLDIKPADGMLLMKKDMGGAAHVLGLAHAIMDSGMKVRLRVLIPAVENAIDGNAYRPLDIITTRKGLTVEVGNTDAEGRLILCDALAEAAREEPELIVDFATLTGAARVALGSEVAAMFTNDDATAELLKKHSDAATDPLWRLPLFGNYKRLLDSKVADMNNISRGSFGGAITAALFLKEFVGDVPWVHFDVMAWNVEAQSGRPVGGEAMGLRATYAAIKERYGSRLS
jgi:leucyl aminopeptidase